MIHWVLHALHFKMGTEVFIWQEERSCGEESWMSCPWMLERGCEQGPFEPVRSQGTCLREPSSACDLVREMWTHPIASRWLIFLMSGVETVMITVLTVSLLPRGWADVFKAQGGHSITFLYSLRRCGLFTASLYLLKLGYLFNKYIQGSWYSKNWSKRFPLIVTLLILITSLQGTIIILLFR